MDYGKCCNGLGAFEDVVFYGDGITANKHLLVSYLCPSADAFVNEPFEASRSDRYRSEQRERQSAAFQGRHAQESKGCCSSSCEARAGGRRVRVNNQ